MNVTGLKTMLYNRMHREKIYSQATFWDSKAEEFEDKAVSMWPNNNLNSFYHSEQLHIINTFLPDVRGKRILDVGCGIGRLSRYFAARGAKVVGFDFSAKTIEIARKQSHGDNPTYRVQSVFDLEDVALYDIVVTWGTLAIACRNREELLNATNRLQQTLKPGGKLLLFEPIHKGFLHRVLNMNVQQFVKVMQATGFAIEDIVHLHFWPMRLALAFIPWPKPITSLGYRLGQEIMKTLFNNRAFGDYKCIYSKVDAK